MTSPAQRSLYDEEMERMWAMRDLPDGPVQIYARALAMAAKACRSLRFSSDDKASIVYQLECSVEEVVNQREESREEDDAAD